MDKILISACLLGDNVRFDGGNNYWPFIEKLREKYDLIPICPEMMGGLPCPRDPSEITPRGVYTKNGKNVSKAFSLGADKALETARFFGARIAILKDGSPSCGCRSIHDGKFTGNKIPGLGVAARRLIAAGIKVYAETDALDFLLDDPEEKQRRLERNLAKEKEAGPRKFPKKLLIKKGDSKEERKPEGKKPFHKSGKAPYHPDGKKPFHKGVKKPYSKTGKSSYSKGGKPPYTNYKKPYRKNKKTAA